MGSSPTSGTNSSPGDDDRDQQHGRVAQAGVPRRSEYRTGQRPAKRPRGVHPQI
ncbi:hypothetical protein [Arthrobacter sp. 7Tela_A1]|uniref:hypothetical protein n=1 Tax=Arthrobacter sp. 7Tela_A1 TaxID=3093745 RepID=UPI003BB72A46